MSHANGNRRTPPGRLILLRHGQTEWSQSGRHTGVTDLPLTERGEELARASRPLLRGFDIVRVVTSPLRRASRTAELLGLPDPEVDDAMVEWDYGGYEGLTTPDIRRLRDEPEWNVWDGGVVAGDTPGETIEQVAARARDVIDRVTPDLDRGDVALVGHGQMLRVLATVWLRVEPRFAGQLPLAAGGLCVLGHEHEEPAIERWNQPPGLDTSDLGPAGAARSHA